MPNLVFVDTFANIDHTQITGRALGASEHQMYKLVASLGTACFNTGNGPRTIDGVLYDNIERAAFGSDAVILLMRSYPYTNRSLVQKLAGHDLILWVHDTPNDSLVDRSYTSIAAAKAEVLANPRLRFVANSQLCRKQLIDYFGPEIDVGRVTVIPNTVHVDEFVKAPVTVDLSRLVYASAWVKGIEGVITLYDYIFRNDPDFHLTLMNPGYDNMERYKGLLADMKRKYGSRVEVLGPQSRAEFSRVVAGSLCTMTARFSETFGCVFAESLALGTPVVADVCSGAVREFAGEEAIVDYGNPAAVLARVVALRAARPMVSLPAGYDAETVVAAWRALLANLR
jgi:glycosyltransferase involved in cell wall biosynthesis